MMVWTSADKPGADTRYRSDGYPGGRSIVIRGPSQISPGDRGRRTEYQLFV